MRSVRNILKFILCKYGQHFSPKLLKISVTTLRHIPKHSNLQTMKSTNALTLQLRFYTQYVRTLDMFRFVVLFRESLYVFMYALLVLINSLTIFNIDRNISQ